MLRDQLKDLPMVAVEPTSETMSLTEFQKRLDSLMGRVSRQETRIVVEENGVPVAGIVSLQDVQRLERLDRKRAGSCKAIEAVAAGFADQSAEDIEREVAKAIAEVRVANRLKAASGKG
jgi:prevent-host-death family protein